MNDGPASPAFEPVVMRGNVKVADLARAGLSDGMVKVLDKAPAGECVCWGIPFRVGPGAVLVRDKAVTAKIRPTRARHLVFLHTADMPAAAAYAPDAAAQPTKSGRGRLGEHVADYVLVYADGTESRAAIRRRRQIGMFSRWWGENCFEAVAAAKPKMLQAGPAQVNRNDAWGRLQTRADASDWAPLMCWLWTFENPHPAKRVVAIRFEPHAGTVVVWGVSAGSVSSNPLRWDTRRKAVLTLPRGVKLDPNVDGNGLLTQIQLDMGQVISASVRPVYPDRAWGGTYNNRVPVLSPREALIEYTAHPDARFHLPGGRTLPVARLGRAAKSGPLRAVAPATQRVTVRVVERGSNRPVAVKLHVHGSAGEYLAPTDRHRIINAAWFEDYSVDFAHQGVHPCTYIPGETLIDLPLGRVYLEVSKGFEIRPVRKVIPVTRATREIRVELEKVLPWRERGWVTADTHVHFLSTESARLEGAGEGVNVVNLLASQWGELMTNVGDFDGRTTWGSKQAGGDGEYLVRVGTENRQHILGHISLLGYNGPIITPMTTGGPDESALGDPIEILLTEWAGQCRRQRGVVIIPHFPNPRCEHAATIVSGRADGVEMTSWGNLYGGIDPYSLADWYRYLNCGCMTAAVGGTDKMSASTAVGTVRTYARLRRGEPFTYEAWKNAVRRADTFVTYGPLVDFAVEGKPPGSRIPMSSNGGTVDVAWRVASVTVPMSRVELIVNGEVRESRAVRPDEDAGRWSVKVGRSSWLALLVRGHYVDKAEIVAAHTSPVMVEVRGSAFHSAADAVSILEQIEGALAYLDTVGTRAETAARKRMRLLLTSIHREFHNRMHRAGRYHEHTPTRDHAEHRTPRSARR